MQGAEQLLIVRGVVLFSMMAASLVLVDEIFAGLVRSARRALENFQSLMRRISRPLPDASPCFCEIDMSKMD
jgi:hypothetical protein